MKAYALRRPRAAAFAAVAAGLLAAVSLGAPAQAAPGDSFKVVAVDVGSPSDRVGPGQDRPLYLAFMNVSRKDTGATITIDLPSGATFAGDSADYEDCEYSGLPLDREVDTGDSGFVYGPTQVSCVLPYEFGPGDYLLLFNPLTGESAFNIVLGKNVPGPAKLPATFGAVEAQAPEESLSRAAPGRTLAAKLASFNSRDGRSAAPSDADVQRRGPVHIGKGSVEFFIFTKANTIDITVSAPALTGAIGSTVELAYTIKNLGPSDGGGPSIKLKAPSGTVFVNDGSSQHSPWCVIAGGDHDPNWTEATDLTCNGESYWPVSQFVKPEGVTYKIKVKVNATPGSDGTVTVDAAIDGSREVTPENNVAPIVITVAGGGLPVTGANAMLIGGVGLGVLVLGAGLFVFTRRRRVVPVTPAQDG